MDNTIYIIIIIFVIIFLVKILNIKKSEHLTQTSDEAIQNLASLYNKDKLTVTNLTVPENATLNNAIINTITATNLTVPGNANITNAKISTINGRNIFAELDDLQVKVVYPVPWDQSKWVKHIQDNNYFNKNMPDGTMRSFLFVHPGALDPSHPNRWFGYRRAVKFGNQFLLFPSSNDNHENVPNPLNNSSNDGSWRGNIN